MVRTACRIAPVAVVIAASLASITCSGSSAQSPMFHPVATVDEVMDGIVIPASETVFDAVVYSNGELIQSPKSDDDWFAVRVAALAVGEAGNLLMMSPRAKDSADWQRFSRQLTDAAVSVAKAADAKDIDAMLSTGSTMYEACTACHEKYITDTAP